MRLRSRVMVGREGDLARLREGAEAARAGEPSLVLVLGEAGVGKTRLATEFAADVRAQGGLVASGHGVDLTGGELPFGVAAELLGDLARQVGPDTVREALGSRAAALGSLVPPLADGSRVQEDRVAALGAARALVEHLGTGQLVCLLVEDLQWADMSSRDLIGYLARSLHDVQVVLVCTVRLEHAPSAAFAEALAELQRISGAETIDLGRLTARQVRAQVTSIVGAEPERDVVDRVIGLSNGLPFYVEELLASGFDAAAPLPDSVRRLVLTRLPGLSPGCRELVDVAALGEGHLHHELLARIAAPDAIRDAVDAGVLEVDESRQAYRFRHALLREAVDDALLPATRADGHRTWAEALEVGHAPMTDNEAMIASARHWYGAGDTRRALALSARAARVARDLEAASEHVRLLRQALDLWPRVEDPEAIVGSPRGDLAVSVVIDSIATGDWVGAVRFCEAELALNDPRLDPVGRTWLEIRHRQSREDAGEILPDRDPRQDAAWAEELLMAPDDVRAVDAMIILAANTSADPLSFSLVERAVDIARRLGRSEGLARCVWAGHQLRLGRAEVAIAELEDVLDGDRGLGFVERLVVSNQLARTLAVTRSSREAVELHERMLSQITDPNLVPGLYMRHVHTMASALLRLGEWDHTLVLLDAGSELLATPFARAVDALLRTRIGLGRGDTEAALRARPIVEAVLPEGSAAAAVQPNLVIFRTALAAATGEPSRIPELLYGVWRRPHPEWDTQYLWEPAYLTVRAEVDAVRRSPADAAVREAAGVHLGAILPVAARLHRFGDLGRAWSADLDAQVARFEGQDEPVGWVAAVDGWRRVGHVHDQAVCQTRLAECLLARGDVAAATPELEEALVIAERLGAAPLEEEIRLLAARARIPLDGAPDAPPLGGQGLTERELQVLRLLAEGKTNNEIASNLFISPKTVSVHVSRLMAKLGASNRTEAAAIASRRDLLHS